MATRVAVRLGVCGALVMAAGGALIGTSVDAWAASGSISFTQSAPIDPTSDLPTTITGSGFHHSSVGALFECSTASGQPTIDTSTSTGLKTVDLGQLPVSCGDETSVVTTGKGELPATAIIGLEEGTLGPPATGPDSAPGGDAATDAANFPCPPTAAQASAQCVVMYADAAGDSASAPITFAASTTATTGPTSCIGQSGSTTAANTTSGASATLTVDPATCLVGGQVVQVSGTGLAANSEGTLLECNSDPSQPTLSLAGQTIPVSCTSLDVISATASGGISTQQGAFTIQTGTTGPPIAATDNTGGSAAADAVGYPCPPTAAQLAANETCQIVFRDAGGDDLVVPISFNPGGAGTSSASKTGSTATASASTAKTVATKASSGSLAFTGAGPLLSIAGLAGLVLIVAGASLLLLAEDPRRLFRLSVGMSRTSEDEG
jgi:hypothetical protein